MKRFLLALLALLPTYALAQIPDCSPGLCAGVSVPAFACKSGQKYTQLDAPGTNFSCSGIPPHWVQDGGAYTLPTASTTVLGGIKVDGSTITVTGGVASASGGALVLVEAHTASNSAELDFTSCLSSTYDDYQIEVVNLIPATDAAYLWLQASTNGGSSYDTTSGHYATGFNFWTFGGSGAWGTAASTTAYEMFRTASNVTANGGVYGKLSIANPLGGTANTKLQGSFSGYATSNSTGTAQLNAGWYTQTTAVNAFRVIASTGNLASGVVRCYGIAH